MYCPSVSLSVCLSLQQSVYLASINDFVTFALSASLSVCVCLLFSLSACLPMPLSSPLSVSLSLSPCLYAVSYTHLTLPTTAEV